jgi:sugar phosphate isomerase/epimerase
MIVAYGDATLQNPPAPWEEFEYTEYLGRLEDLLKERGGAFMRSCHPDAPPDADDEWRRLDKELEQTAIEFAAYAARLRLKSTWPKRPGQ